MEPVILRDPEILTYVPIPTAPFSTMKKGDGSRILRSCTAKLSITDKQALLPDATKSFSPVPGVREAESVRDPDDKIF